MPKRKPDSTALSADVLPQVVQRYLAGESLQAVAADLRVHRSTLYRWMLGGIGDQNYRELVTDCLITRVSDADQMLQDASDQCDIARAREIARFARMDLERRRPQLYGQRVEVTKSDPDPRALSTAELVAMIRQHRKEQATDGEVVGGGDTPMDEAGGGGK